MAFASRIGNALRRTTASSSWPLLQSVRCMSSSKLFVAGLSYATDETTLKNAFSRYGDVLEARIIADRESGRSRGFGFVTYTSSEEAATAINAMDGKELQGRTVHVNHANDQAGGIRGSSYGVGLYATTGYGAGSGSGSSSGSGYGAGGGHSSGGCGGNSGGYAGNDGYNDGAAGSYGSNYYNVSAGRYAGSDGYSGGTSGSSGGGYGSGGMYNTTGNFGGNSGGYNSSPNAYGAGNYSTGGVGGGTLGEFGRGFSGGGFGVTGRNHGYNLTGNTYGGYRSSAGGFSGGAVSYGADKPQYNGQDDLLGDDYFDDKEVAENT